MTPVYLDATTLIALGTIGELDRLETFEGALIVLPTIRAEVTTEPARTNLARFLEHPRVTTTPPIPIKEQQAMELLETAERSGDTRLLGAVVAHTAEDATVGIVSDDRRVRTVARGLGATVTGTVGVIVRAVAGGLSVDAGIAIVRRLDAHGLHMTAELRERAVELMEAAGE